MCGHPALPLLDRFAPARAEVRVIRQTSWVILGSAIALATLWPSQATAQRRVVRRPVVRSHVYVVARPYYNPYYYSPFYAGWYAGYGWYPYGWYGQYYPDPYYRSRYYNTGAARLQVTPREAQVYIDGYFSGSVDDYDGRFQRLHVEAGEHELQLYLPGYRTIREKVLFRPGATLKVSYTMERLAAGEAAEPRPSPAEGARRTPAPRGGYPPDYGRPRGSERAPREGQRASDSGDIAIRVQPADAEISIDGERWEAPQGGERLIVQLDEGEHRVEIHKDGYRPFSTTVRVRRGETAPLNVSLTRQDEQ